MAKAVRLGKAYKFNKSLTGSIKAKISCEQGECILDSQVDIMGIEIDFKGKAEFTPQLPEGWILQGNNNKILIFSISGLGIQKQTIFTYEGEIDVTNVIICDKNSNVVKSLIQRSQDIWENQFNILGSDTTNWNEMKIKKSKKRIRQTSYNLPDYNLPEVDKEEIKRNKAKNQTRYSRATNSGSIGGH